IRRASSMCCCAAAARSWLAARRRSSSALVGSPRPGRSTLSLLSHRRFTGSTSQTGGRQDGGPGALEGDGAQLPYQLVAECQFSYGPLGGGAEGLVFFL